jgi:hypothetical protein
MDVLKGECGGVAAVFEMMVERVSALEAKMDRLLAANAVAAHMDEHKPHGAVLSGLAHCCPPTRVTIQKLYDGPIRRGCAYAVEVPGGVLDGPSWTSLDTLTQGKATGEFDAAFSEAFGTAELAEVQAAYLRAYANHSPKEIVNGECELSKAAGCVNAKHTYYSDELLERIVRHIVPEVLAVGSDDILISFHSRKGDEAEDVPVLDLMRTVRNALEVLDKPFPTAGDLKVRHACHPKLAACVVRENDDKIKTTWRAMTGWQQNAVRRNARDGGFYEGLTCINE